MIGITLPGSFVRRCRQYRGRRRKREADPGSGRRIWIKLPADRTIFATIAESAV
jgi:hypothetical protein